MTTARLLLDFTAQTLAQDRSLEDRLRACCDRFVAQPGMEFAGVWVTSEDGKSLAMIASSSDRGEPADERADALPGHDAIRLSTIVAVIEDQQAGSGALEKRPHTFWRGLPLTACGATHGALMLVYSTELQQQTSDELGALAAALGLAVQHDRLSRHAAYHQNLLHKLIAVIGEGIVVIDADGVIAFASPIMAQLLSGEDRDLVGRPLAGLVNGQMFDDSIRQQQQALSPQQPSFADVPLRVIDARFGRRTFRVSGCRLADRDGSSQTLLSFKDTTGESRLRETSRWSQQHFQSLIDQVTDYAIFMTDIDHRATSWNAGVEVVLGYAEEEFVGQDIVPLIFTPEARAMGVPDWEFQTAAAKGSASDDRWMVRKGGEQFWASGITTGLYDEEGELIGYNKVMRDLTNRKESDDALRRLAAELSAADARKNEFLATLAHELRNPLSPIKTAAQLMQMVDNDSTKFRELSGVIDRQVKQMVRLIDDLLDVSRISRGQLQLQKEHCDLREVIVNALEAAEPFIKKSGQQLHIDAGDQSLFVWGDPARLAQVLVNLLNNAAKYTPAAGAIWLSASRDKADAVLEVRDNGVGIVESQLSIVFDMFQQVDTSKQRGQSGLGIGLSLVKELVELHGGQVSAHSGGRGHGSCFTVRIPLLSDHASTDEASKPAERTGALTAESLPPSRSFRVLVVEDTRPLRVMLARLLRVMGHQVEEAANGLEGLEKTIAFRPEVIFSDISMPLMNGHEMAQKLREKNLLQGVQLVALTGYGQDADRENATASGFDDHMVKPADAAVLAKYFANLS